MDRFKFVDNYQELPTCDVCGEEMWRQDIYFTDVDLEVSVCSFDCMKKHVTSNFSDYVDIIRDAFEEA